MKHRLAFWTGLIVAAVVTLAWGGFTMADDGSAYVIGHVCVAPAATVSRELSQQPTRMDIVEVRRTPGCVVYLDPQVDYLRGNRNHNPIDANHFIIRSKQLAASMNNPGVVIIHGGQTSPQNTQNMVPMFILSKPGTEQGQPAMPSVPEPSKSERKLVVAQ